MCARAVCVSAGYPHWEAGKDEILCCRMKPGVKHMCLNMTDRGHHGLMMLQLVRYLLVNLWSVLSCHTCQGVML